MREVYHDIYKYVLTRSIEHKIYNKISTTTYSGEIFGKVHDIVDDSVGLHINNEIYIRVQNKS